MHDMTQTPVPDHQTPVTLQDIADYYSPAGASASQEILAFDTLLPDAHPAFYPVRINALIIVLCYKGTGRLTIDMTDYELRPGTLLTLNPNNYLQFVSMGTDCRCHTVVCAPSLVEQMLPKLTSFLPMLMDHRRSAAIQLTQEEADGITSFYHFIKLKLDGEPTPNRRAKLVCVLQAAIYEAMDIHLQRNPARPSANSRKEEIMARFLLSVCDHFRTQRQVSFYSKQLCITPKHLSSVVKEISGRTASEWIDHYVILEIKMLLGSTDMTIQEISTRLCFANQSFFGKYFKHHTGLSPSEFRLAANAER